MSYDEQNTLVGKLLFLIATITGYTGFSLQEFDLYLGIFLKFLSVISFILFVLINHKSIIRNYREVRYFYKRKKK